ncbi:hypothetical protein IFM89_010818 [Coptis chinensis]|uniref:C2 domain-containing protein n=1 Tax=Coptis chinensis TaxID=261450 RepID=A0A835IMY1_9MAGN|nr:hypothetical protein IFM89_010818 [Coptis chinensis]
MLSESFLQGNNNGLRFIKFIRLTRRERQSYAGLSVGYVEYIFCSKTTFLGSFALLGSIVPQDVGVVKKLRKAGWKLRKQKCCYPTSTTLFHTFKSNSDSARHSQNPSAYVSSPSLENSQHGQFLQIVPVRSSKSSLKVMLLHGNLDIWVYEVKNLPNMDMFHKTLTDMFVKRLGNVTNKIEGHVSKVTSDPYVTVLVANAVVGRSYVISNNDNPVWTQHFSVPIVHHAAEAHFIVKDSDIVGSQDIAVVAIPVENIISGNKIE